MQPTPSQRRIVLWAAVAFTCIGLAVLAYELAPAVRSRIAIDTTHNGDVITLRGTLGKEANTCDSGYIGCGPTGFQEVDLGPGIQITLYMPTINVDVGPSQANDDIEKFLSTAVIDPQNKTLGPGSPVEIHGRILKDANTVYIQDPGDYLKAL